MIHFTKFAVNNKKLLFVGVVVLNNCIFMDMHTFDADKVPSNVV